MRKYDSYKDSGVEWLGKVPAQWTNHRIDWITSLVRGNTGLKKDELLDKGEYVACHIQVTNATPGLNNNWFITNIGVS